MIDVTTDYLQRSRPAGVPRGWGGVAASDPVFLRDPRSKIEKAFQEFHVSNPHVYDEIERRVDRLRERGHRRIGIAMVYEAMRYDFMVKTETADFKLNNNFKALYARLLIHRRPELRNAIETRVRREAFV